MPVDTAYSRALQWPGLFEEVVTVDTSGILARHHWRLVDRFVESVLDELDLGDLERNIVGLALRREVETGLVPGVVAIQAVFHAADGATLGKILPEWLDCVSSTLPAEAQFLSEMGRRLDPHGADLFEENLGLRPGESEVRRSFESHLWELAPCIQRVGQ